MKTSSITFITFALFSALLSSVGAQALHRHHFVKVRRQEIISSSYPDAIANAASPSSSSIADSGAIILPNPEGQSIADAAVQPTTTTSDSATATIQPIDLSTSFTSSTTYSSSTSTTRTHQHGNNRHDVTSILGSDGTVTIITTVTRAAATRTKHTITDTVTVQPTKL